MDYSYRGKETEEFEIAIGELTGSKYVLATNTGTSALHLSYICSGIKPNEEVIVPALTFIGTINPIVYIGAIPHFVDCDDCLGIDTKKLEHYLSYIGKIENGIVYNKLTNRKISAIVAVHVLGNPIDIEEINRIALHWGLKVIEDAAQAIGSYIEKPDNYRFNQHVGTHSDFGIISFNGNKLLTTGGGGAILTWSKDYYNYVKHLSMTAKDQSQKQNYHDQIGFNYRMPAWNAILGLKNLKKLNKNIELCYNKYRKLSKEFEVIPTRKHTKPNYWRTGIIDEKQNNSFQPIWGLVSDFPMYQYCPKMDLSKSRYYKNYLYIA